MPCIGNARVGHKAPSFKCDAVVSGEFKEVSLDLYTKRKQWLILLFIPAAFSFVCPTEVLAFHNCIDEFMERNCEIVFVSTDSKHSLWQWQHMPRQFGGLGKVRVTLASDQSHQMSRNYCVLLEGKGMDLRGMYIIDPEGIIQQITINNIAVGRSVLEALRLVEAFTAAAERGVLCPANWNPGDDFLTESYEDQDPYFVRDLGDMQVKDLDTNTVQPFNLVLPRHAMKTTDSNPTALNTSSKEIIKPISSDSIGKSNNASAAANSRVVTLEFSGPLTEIQGAESQHNFVAVNDNEGFHGEKKESREGNTSPTTNVQRGLDALKRMSSGWSTPLGSPGLSGTSPVSGKKGQAITSASNTSYFD